MKNRISQTIVVEGKTDLDRLKSLFDVDVITTNGSCCDKKTISIIKQINKTKGVILFLDPDYVGESIRKKILQHVPNLKQCFISKNDMKTNSKKIGIAEATDEAIINALNNIVDFNQLTNCLSQQEYNSLELDSKNKRLNLCNKLNISYCNNKQLFKRLNMLSLTKQKLDEILKNEN